jgi:hypothetical protein
MYDDCWSGHRLCFRAIPIELPGRGIGYSTILTYDHAANNQLAHLMVMVIATV